ncbi:MAG: DUF484 family protein [bacterium]
MAPISADEVAQFLEANPRFFLDHPETLRSGGLLEEDESPENVLNMRDRLLEMLKRERGELIQLLDQAIDTVRQNEEIEKNFLAIENLLFGSRASPDVLGRVAEELERRFSLDHASLLLFGKAERIPRGGGEAAEGGFPRVRLASEAGSPAPNGILLAGGLAEGAAPPFPEACREGLRSTAIVPLREEENLLGLLLLGSEDPDRYRKGMQTDLLDRLSMRLALGLSLLVRLAPEVAPTPGGAPAGGKAKSPRRSRRKTAPK